jgi:murein DD-endopeptidase MepM/ murein hydrolase activator NlpD
MVSRRFLIVCLVVSAPGAVVLGVVLHSRFAAARQFVQEVALAREDAERIRQQVVLFTERKLAAGLTLADSLQRMGLDAPTTASIVGSAQAAYDLRRLRAGNLLAVGRSVAGEVHAIRYQIDADRMLWILPRGRTFHAEIKPIPSHTEIAGVTGEIRDSLFNAVTDAGESPELAMRLAEIFGWDLDFYTDPRPGDTFRMVVEKKKYLDGRTAAYGRILAAEYDNDGRAYQALLFHDPYGKEAYYAPDGKSLQKAFLRSPLRFAAPITSHFSRSRYHPILKVRRPHLGIDYGAPIGTPVQAIGSGRVVFAGRKGGAGNLVHVQHANGYETMYMHLSRVLVHTGQHVEQGQRIGLVGMTGLATGPHLDFRIRQHGAYRNFETLRLPPAQPVGKRDWGEFVATRQRWLPLLPDAHALQAAARPQAPGSAGGPADRRAGSASQ